MNSVKPLIIFASLLLSQLSFASDGHEEGEKLYKSNCAVCHGSTGGMDFDKRLGPPIAAVRLHYIESHQDKESFVNAVTGWVEKQDPNKSLMRGAIRKFNIMPPIKISKEDSQKIAEYIYAGNIEEVEGFREHVEEEHGKKGKMNNNQQQKNHKKGYGAGKGKKMQQLNLTSDQQVKIKALKAERKTTLQPLKEQLHQIKMSIEELDTASPNYKADIFALADKQAALVHRIVIEKGEMRFKFDSLLTDEQKAQVKSSKQNKMRGKHGYKHKNKHGKKHSQMQMN